MRLVYLVANAAWVFTFGDQIIRLEHETTRFFDSRAAAVEAAGEHNLLVDRQGNVYAEGVGGANR